ncbi:MAG: ADP-ribosylglycohydrolase family protein [Bacteroidetes bacterium]|nr:ADP-ribosylglycohydrolase family protein [Bacteroidota bacterium]
MTISWLNIPDRIKHELRQREEEGIDVRPLSGEWERIIASGLPEQEFIARAVAFYRQLESLPVTVANVVNEPSDWESIAALCSMPAESKPSLTEPELNDRLLGGWLGRSAGCLLGKPIEKMTRETAKELLSSNGTWPISDYISGKGIPEDLLKKYPWNRHYGKESLKENIVCMTEDDDMNYPMLNLSVFEQYGPQFTAGDVVKTWMEMAPVLTTFTAERVAYHNALGGLQPPATATSGNPYREWIGAQIRADLWGWISPGQPARAAEFAWRDASVSHVRNGMYGEIFFAAVIASAFTIKDLRTLFTQGLNYIPVKSRLAEALRFVLSLPLESQPWETTVDALYAKFGRYHWVHTINNAALVVAAVISSKGNYEQAICNVVMGGWDTDSNGATVGSIMGTMFGAEALPEKWTGPLNGTIRSSLKGFDHSLFATLARRTKACI